MSIDICNYCHQYVDTDQDPEFYVDVPGKNNHKPTTIKMCQRCREKEDFYD